jgi:peptidoglycan/LPS O-acetylase OafA/YrhL/lysophospholipase L1-like esterase
VSPGLRLRAQPPGELEVGEIAIEVGGRDVDVVDLRRPPGAAPEPRPVPGREPGRGRGRDKPDVSMPYTPGFDGLRAYGLLMMLAYHHGVEQARGGIFTVSMFFTLSGYLIATLALAEMAKTDRLSMRRFWERRARRLLPAALVTVVGIVALQWFYGVGAGDRFRGDVITALGYAANWRMAYSGGDYAAAFTLEAPVQHFWSLAVEEQFYLAFPVLFVGLMALSRGRWRLVGWLFAAGAAASFVAAWITASNEGSNSGLAYYATYTRASEILVGVALAFLVVTTPVQRFLRGPAGVRAGRVAGVLGLAGLTWLWTQVGLKDPFVFRGATALNATCTSLVIVACVSPSLGLAARGLGLWPLRNLGKVSYAVYLFHWPLFLLFDQERTGLGYWPLFAFRVGLTIVLATVSYHLLESPFRFKVARRSRPQLAAVLGAACAAVLALVAIVPVHPAKTISFTGDGDEGPVQRGEVAAPKGDVALATSVLMLGDSVSWSMLPGLDAWNEQHDDQQLLVQSYRAIACTLGEAGPVKSLGTVEQPTSDCRNFRPMLPGFLSANDFDAIVVTMGGKDLSERQFAGRWLHLGDHEFDEWFRGEVDELADILAVEGVPVLWTTWPHVQIAVANDPASRWQDYDDNDPARVDRLNEIVAEEVAGRPRFEVVDVGGWLQSLPGGEESRDHRADGVHLTVDGSQQLGRWLVPQILDAVSLG